MYFSIAKNINSIMRFTEFQKAKCFLSNQNIFGVEDFWKLASYSERRREDIEKSYFEAYSSRGIVIPS